MTRKPKPIITHSDRLGRELCIDDYVAYPSQNSLEIGVVVKLNNKMIRIQPVNNKHSAWYRRSADNKYPTDVIKLDGPEVTFYLLQHQPA